MIGEFAQIVGLLSAFSSGRKLDESVGLSEFLTWLSEHNHEEIKQLIENNQKTATSIKVMLNSGFQNVNEKLDGISGQLANLATKYGGVDGVARSLADTMLSDQALDILYHMERHDTEHFILAKAMGQPPELIMSPGTNYSPNESRFLEDDLYQLVDLGLLQSDCTSRGDAVYRYTRAASSLVRSNVPTASLEIDYQQQQGGTNEHKYMLSVWITNNDHKPFRKWHVDVEFPNILRTGDDRYLVASQSTEEIALFRVVSDESRADCIFPGQQKRVLRRPYRIDQELFGKKVQWWGKSVVARAYIEGKLPVLTEVPMRNLQNF